MFGCVVPRPSFVGKVHMIEPVWKLKPVVANFHAAFVDTILVPVSRIFLEQFNVSILCFVVILRKEVAFPRPKHCI